MAFEMWRVFCATPVDLEAERQTFYEAIGEINEQQAMPMGVLLVPVSVIPNVYDMLAFEALIDDNVRASKFYVQVLQDSWGPPKRNFERQFEIAASCEGRAVFFKTAEGREIEPKVARLKAGSQEFADTAEFKTSLHAQLSEWLAVSKVLNRTHKPLATQKV